MRPSRPRWHRYSLRCPSGYNLAGITAASPSDVVFLCTDGLGTFHTYKAVLLSANGGRTEHLAGQARIERDVNGRGGAIAVPPGRVNLITIAVYFAGPSFLDRSADGGKTWTEIPVPAVIFSFQDRHVVDLGGHVEDGVVDVTAVAA
jgi:hypothetical protein